MTTQSDTAERNTPTPGPIPDRTKTAYAHLALLFGDDVCDEHAIVFFSSNDVPVLRIRELSEENISEVLKAYGDDCNIYFGLGLQKFRRDRTRRGGIKDVNGIGCVWAEVDFGPKGDKAQPATKEEALALIAEMPVPPSKIVFSGAGFHAYWLFKEPWIFADGQEKQRAADLEKRWVRRLQQLATEHGWKTDDVSDLSRVLRLPGSFNVKYEQPIEVTMERFDDRCRYDIDHLESLVENIELKSCTGPADPVAVDASLPGDDFGAKVSWQAILVPHGWSQVGGERELTLWKRPGNDVTSDFSAKSGFISTAGRDLLVVHSTSDPVLPVGTYNKFRAYSLLNHGGDDSAAASDLARQGHGGIKEDSDVDLSVIENQATVTQINVSPEQQGVQITQEPADATTEISNENEIPSHLLPYKTFPTHPLPPVMTDLIEQGAEVFCADQAMIALPLLSTYAAAIGNSYWVRVTEGWEQPLVLWSVVLSESGTLKDPCIRLATRPMEKEVQRLLEQHGDAMVAFRQEKLKYQLAKNQFMKGDILEPPIEPAQPVLRDVLTDDATVEGVVRMLSRNRKGCLLASAEFSGWVTSWGQYKGGSGQSHIADQSLWLKTFGGFLKKDRSGSPTIHVPNAFLAIAGMTQPEVFRKVAGDKIHRHSGLLARFLLAMPEKTRKQWQGNPLSKVTLDAHNRVYTRLRGLEYGFHSHLTDRWAYESKHVGLSKDAMALARDFVDGQGSKTYYDANELGAVYSKMEGYAFKLAALMHLVEWAGGDDPEEEIKLVPRETLERAIELCGWFEYEAERVYATFDLKDYEEKDAYLIKIAKRYKGRLTASKLHKANKSRWPNVGVATIALEAATLRGLFQIASYRGTIVYDLVQRLRNAP